MKNIDGIKINRVNIDDKSDIPPSQKVDNSPFKAGNDPQPSSKNPSFVFPAESVSENYFSKEHYKSDNQFRFNLGPKYSIAEPKKKTRWKKFFLIFFFTLLVSAMAYFAYFSFKARAVTKKINFENNSSSVSSDVKSWVAPIVGMERKKLKGEENGRINMLLLGAAGENKPGKNLTDTVMIMSIDTKDKKVGLISLPRDLYVNIPETKKYTKINSLYQIGLNEKLGIDLIKTAVEKITALPIHYYFVIDFQGFEKIIDDLGGINLNVERDIYDARYPGPNYNYETFELKKGWQILDGPTALKYVRERHNDPEGDFGRAKRQQQVLQTAKNKAFSIGTILNAAKLNDLLNNLEKNLKTNIVFDEIESFIALSKEVDTENISNKVVDAWKKDSLLKVSHVFYGNTRAFVLVPRAGNFSEVAELAKNIFSQEANDQRINLIRQEQATIELRNGSGHDNLASKVKEFIGSRTGLEKISTVTADVDQQETVVFDCTDGEKIYSLDEVIKKIPAKLITDSSATEQHCQSDNSKKSDLVLLLGQDIAKHYLMEESSMKELDESENDQEVTIFE